MKSAVKSITAIVLSCLMLMSVFSVSIPGITGAFMNIEAQAAGVAGYNATAAAKWADAHVYDVDMGMFGKGYWDVQGDCANFVSHALYMGGLDLTYNWHLHGYKCYWGTAASSPYEGSFIRATQLKRYLISIGGQEIRNPSADQVSVGDVIFYWRDEVGRIGHSAIVVRIENGVPIVAAHSDFNSDSGIYKCYTSESEGWRLGYSGEKVYLIKMYGALCSDTAVREADVYYFSSRSTLYNDAGGSSIRNIIGGSYTHVYETRNVNGVEWGRTMYYGSEGWFILSSGNYVRHIISPDVSHTFDSWTTIKTAKCNDAGQEKRTCTRCGYVQYRDIQGLVHVVTKHATCNVGGFCDICGVMLEAPLKHNFVTVTQAPDCITDGAIIDKCSICQLELRQTITKLGHDLVAQTTAPTCIEAGSSIRACQRSGCGYSELANPENIISGWTTEYRTDMAIAEQKTEYRYRDKETTHSRESSKSGWTQDGSSWVEIGSTTKNYATFPAGFDTNNSIYQSFEKAMPVSAIDTDSYKRVITDDSWTGFVYWHWMYDCGGDTARNRMISDHSGYISGNSFYYKNFGAFLSANAYNNYYNGYYNNTGRTSYEDSQSSSLWFRFDYYTCSYVDYSMIYSYWRWSSWSEWQDTPVSTTTDREVETRTVYRYYSDLRALGHSFTEVVETVYPTCTAEGHISYECERCGVPAPTVKISPETGHSLTEWMSYTDAQSYAQTNNIAADLSVPYVSDNWIVRFCTNTDHNTDEPCDYCEIEDDSCTFIETENVLPTCNADGYILFTCTRHGETKTEVTSKLGHSFTEVAEIVYPNCTTEGHISYKCDRCGAIDPSTVITPATKHSLTEWMSYEDAQSYAQTNSIAADLDVPYASDNWIVRFCTNTDQNNGTRCTYCEKEDDSCTYIKTESVLPTCNADGYILFTCTRHGETKTDVISKLGHSLTAAPNAELFENDSYPNDLSAVLGDSWIITQMPTCSEEGSAVTLCERYDNNVACLCDEHVGDNSRTITLPKLAHTVKIISAAAATCTQAGSTAGAFCKVCGTVLTASEEIPPLGHARGEWETIMTPSCGNVGLKQRCCTRCDAVLEEETIETLPHTYVEIERSEPTCYADGYVVYECINEKDGTVCTHGEGCTNLCGERFRIELTERPEHNLEFVTDRAALCVYDGSGHYSCTNAGCQYQTEQEVIAAEYTEHDLRNVTSTCLGSTSYSCSRCDYCETNDDVNGHILPAAIEGSPYTGKRNTEQYSGAGYAYAQGEAPTCTAGGTLSCACERDGCDYVDRVPVEALGHNYLLVGTSQADCLTNGISTYKCSLCDDTFTVDVYNPLGHDWDTATYTWSADHSSCTAATVCRRDSSHTLTQTVDSAVDTTASSCTVAGIKTFTATFSEAVFETQTYSEETAVSAHLFTNYISDGNATCTADGTETAVCDREGCGATDTRIDTGSALGHKFDGNWQEYRPATYDEEGEARDFCARGCGHYSTKNIDRIPYRAIFVAADSEGALLLEGGKFREVATVSYYKGAENITKPVVPVKEGYNGEWETFTLNENPLIYVKAIYNMPTQDDVEPIETEKTAEYTNGIVTINMSAFAKSYNTLSTFTEGTPLDIVLVVDQSGSMSYDMKNDSRPANDKDTRRENLKAVASSFINKVYENAQASGANHRVAVVGFAYANDRSVAFQNTALLTPSTKGYASLTAADYRNAMMDVSTQKDELLSAVASIQSKGATAADLGMEMATNVFANNLVEDGTRKRLVIFLTDGAPTYYSGFDADVANCAILKANRLKGQYGATVYSIGITESANPDDTRNDFNKFLHYTSSNYKDAQSLRMPGSGSPDGNYYVKATDTQTLQNIFENIFVRSVVTKVPFDKVTFHDVVSEEFTMTIEQEEAFRDKLWDSYAVGRDNIIITRNADGTTKVEVRDVPTSRVYDENSIMTGYSASISFDVTANEKVLEPGTYNTNNEAWLEINGGIAAYFDSPSVTIDSLRSIAIFKIGDEPYAIREVTAGGNLSAPDTDIAVWELPESITERYTVINSSFASEDCTVYWTVSDSTLAQKYKAGEVIVPPDVTAPEGMLFTGWSSPVPYRMPNQTALAFDAVFISHTHSYDTFVKAYGTCDVGIVSVYTCDCGETTQTAAAPAAHSYQAEIMNVASSTTCTCTVCGAYSTDKLHYSYSEKQGRPIYDLTLRRESDNVAVQPENSIAIVTPVPDSMQASVNNGKEVSIRWYKDGSGLVKLPTEAIGKDFIRFSASHFCLFAVSYAEETNADILACGAFCGLSGHVFGEWIIYAPATCTETGLKERTCSVCGYTETVTIDIDSHSDGNNDGYCDNCDTNICSCNCHKSGIQGFFWKILCIFYKLFGVESKRVCACGAKHW